MVFSMREKQTIMMSIEEINNILKDQGMVLRKNVDEDKDKFGYVLCKIK